MAQSPRTHEDYQIGVICALATEMAAMVAMLDETHPKLKNEKGDNNEYTLGRIGVHDIVIACLPAGLIGNSPAAIVGSNMQRSFPIKFGLMVGVGGGVWSKKDDIRLGDVVVSQPTGTHGGVVQWDYGKMEKDGKFRRTGSLDKPPPALLHALQELRRFDITDGVNLEESLSLMIRNKPRMGKDYRHQGIENDVLFKADYNHEGNETCDSCDIMSIVQRPARKDLAPRIHYGNIASGNEVIKHGTTRDKIANEEGVICFEMEAAGLIDNFRCLVIRGICDYADSHKNKRWQPYAAATAAAYAKELLSIIPAQETITTDKSVDVLGVNGRWLVPFGRNKQFVGRTSELAQIMAKLNSNYVDDCQRVAIAGLGGIGKTQMALEVAFQIQTLHPDCSVFWVPAIDATTFERAFREIGQKLQIPGIDEDKADVKLLVKMSLSQESAGRWLMIIDNADDVGMLYTKADKNSETNISSRLVDYLPFSRKGSILFTTRDGKAASKQAEVDVVMLKEMSQSDSLQLLKISLQDPNLLGDTIAARKLLDILTYLPLAIKQAAAFINENTTSISEYLEICESNEDQFVKLLSRDFEDKGRYKNATAVRNPIALTWSISFRQILTSNKLAAKYLFFMSCIAQQHIPDSLLPKAPKLKRIDALGTLKAYGFITPRDGQLSYDIHRLVQIAIRNWLKEKNEVDLWNGRALRRLAKVFPSPTHENRDIWLMYLPHANYILSLQGFLGDFEKYRSHLLFKVSKCFEKTGKYREAEQMCRQTLELRGKVFSVDHPSMLRTASHLALVLWYQGKYNEAEKIHRQTLELQEKRLGIDHQSTLWSMNNLALVLRDQGKYDVAEKMLQQELELAEKVFGIDHILKLECMNNLASVLYKQGKYDRAEKMYRQTIELKEKVLGIDHPSTLDSMHNLAAVPYSQGRYDEAEKMYRQTLELTEKVLGIDHPSTLMTMDSLAAVFQQQGKYDEAEKMNRQALELMEKVLGINHPSTLLSMNNLANVLQHQGKYEEAMKTRRHMLEAS